MHLIVIHHGMWGNSSHLQSVVNAIQSEVKDSLVHNCSVNSLFYSYQGIDYCGLRLRGDVLKFIKSYNSDNSLPISQISFIGYSAGGLINRYCIGLLQTEGFFDRVEPLHFITIATPHLGTRVTSRTFSGRFFNRLMELAVPIYAGRSGCQMLLIDNHGSDRVPLLQDLACSDSPYIAGLARFPHKYVYSNINNDNTVPYSTSSLSYSNKWKGSSPGAKDSSVLGYKHIRGCERIDLEHSPFQDQLATQRKAEEFSWGNALYALFLTVVLSPLVVLQLALLIVPLRIISLCYSMPEGADAELLPVSKSINASGVTDVELSPWVILRNLQALDIYRVSVFIPGPHTHGLIINRREAFATEGGSEVIRHIVSEVLPKKKEAVGSADAYPVSKTSAGNEVEGPENAVLTDDVSVALHED
jgi:hypothetical protein